METSADQNSAGILSVFHCILTWSFAVSSNKHTDPEGKLKGEKIQAMIDIYRHMKNLRLTIHGIENPDFISISEVSKPFYVFSEMSKENWNEELRSLMGEIVNMRDVLKGIKERLQSTNISKCSTLFGVENGSQPKNIISLLTVWYWLAAWSSPDQPENGGAKYEFVEAIEANDKMLGFLMVNTSPIHPVEEQELQVLFAKLLQMLKSDHLFWLDILNRFTDKMVSTHKNYIFSLSYGFFLFFFIMCDDKDRKLR